MAINFIKKEDLSHITRTTRQWETTIDRYEIIPKGVLCIELCNDKLTKIKIGNGHLIYEQLPYVSDVNLSDYYTKEETNNLIKDLKSIKIKGEASSLSDLPLRGNEEGDLWFVSKSDPDEHNRYDEYVWYKNKWESFGSSDIDLSEYAKKSYVDTHIQEVQNEIAEIIESGYLHKHSNKDILDQTSAVYNVEKDNKLRDLHNYDDTELREKAHTHLNKNILDQIDAVYNRDKDDKLSSLHNYDDTDVKDRISTLEGVAHSHSNQDILDRTTAAFTKEQALILLDCKDFVGTDGVHDGYHGFVPAPTASDAGKVLGANGQWVEGGSSGGDTITQGGGIEITTDSQTGVKTVSVNAGTGLDIDPQTGELYVTSTGGDTIAEGNGIDITTDSQTGVKTISVDIGDGLQFNQNSEIDINTGDGLSINQYNELTVNTGEGLSINNNNAIELDKATTTTIGGVIVGDNLSIDNTGTLSADEYTPGEGISIDSNKEVSVKYNSDGLSINASDELELDKATKNSIGGVIVGDNIDVNNGTISVPKAASNKLGVIKPSDGLSVDNTGELSVNVGDALSIDSTDNDINVNVGDGLQISQDNELEVSLGNGLQFDSNDDIEVNTGDGLSVNQDNELEVNVGDGLTVDTNNNLKAKIGAGLHFNENNAIEADEIDIDTYEPGNGISFIRHYARDLPVGYTQLEYIESRFDAGFILDYYPQKTSRIVCEAAFVDVNRSNPSDNCLFGSRNGNISSSKQFVFWFNNKTSDPYYVGFVYTGDTWSSVGEHPLHVNLYQRLLFEISPSIGVYCNNVLIQNPLSYPDRDPSPYKLGILCLALSDTTIDTSRNYQSGRIYTFKIYESDTLVVDLVPCLNDSDVPGLYDMVSEVFYPSASGTDFSYDPDTFVTHDSITIDANRGAGIIYENNALALNPGSGLSIDANNDQKLNVNLADGLSIKNTSTNAIKINTGDGLSVDSTTNNLNVNIGDGLVKDSSNNIAINNNSDFYINTNNQFCINPLYAPTYEAGNGVQFVSTSPYNLPPNYTKLSCVESKNTSSDKSAFRLNYVPTTETKFDVLFGITKTSSDVTIIGSGGSNTAKYSLNITRSSAATNNTTVRFNYCQDSSSTSISFTTAIGDILHIVADKNGVYVNNNLVQTPIQTGSPSSYKLCVGSSPATNTAATFRDPSTPGKYYDIKIYEGSTLTVHLIPCLNDSNVPGMYDEVNELFYHNEWKTDFHYDENEKTRPGYYVQAKLGSGLQFDTNGAIEVVNGGTEYTAGDGIDIDANDEISVKIGNHLSFDQTTGNINVDDIIEYTAGDGISITLADDIDVFNNGDGWENLCYSDSTGNSTTDNYQWEIHSPISSSLTIPQGVTQIKAVAKDTNDNLIWTSFSWIDSNDYHFASTAPNDGHYDDWFDIPSGSVKVNFGVRWTRLSTSQAISTSDVDSVTVMFDNGDTKRIDVNVGDGLFIDSTNNDVNVKIGQALSINNSNEIDVNLGQALSINNDNEIDVDIATSNSLGVVKPTDGLSVDNTGELYVNTGDGLSINQNNELEVSLGGGLQFDQNGAVEAPVMGASGTNHSSGLVPDPGSTEGTSRFLREDGSWEEPPSYELPIAGPAVLGGIKIGDGIDINSNGVASVNKMDPFRVGRGLTMEDESERLPTGYYKAKYIESDGSAYTAIPFTPASYPNAKVIGKAMVTGVKPQYNQGYLFGTTRANNWTGHFNFVLSTKTTSADSAVVSRFYYGNMYGPTDNPPFETGYSIGDILEFEMSASDGLKIDNETIHSISSSMSGLSTPYSFAIFGLGSASGTDYMSKARIYSLKIYNGDILLVNLVPAYRQSDEKVGFYNTVNSTFYVSSNNDHPFTTDLTDLDPGDPDWVLKANIATDSSIGEVIVGDGLSVANDGTVSVHIGSGLEINQTTGAIDATAQPLEPATANTIGGVIVGNGLTVTSDGTISTATGKAYIAGEGINMSSSQYEFSAENEQYLFRSQVTCELHGSFNREFQKYTDDTALGIIWNVYDSGTLWSGPLFVGLSADAVKYTTNSTTYSALGTFSYLGKTWYYSDTQYYVSNIDGTDYDGNMVVDTETYASTSDIVQACKSLIDRARVILKVDEISLLPATEDTLGGIKIGEGLSIDENNVVSSTVYEEGQGITFETSGSTDSFDVKNKEYYFDDIVSCQLNGDYGPRTFTRVSTDPCLLAIVQTTSNGVIWSGPLAVGLTENSAKYSNSYDGTTLGPNTSFDYKGYTWYLTYDYGLMNSTGVDLMGNVPSIDMTSIDVSDRNDLYLLGQALIDTAELITEVNPYDVWDSSTWLNGAYNDSQSDQFWTNWYYTYHSKQDEYFELPEWAIKMRLIGISNENDSRLQGGGVDCFDSSHHHFTSVGCITDEWADIPEGTVYVQFGVKWNELNDRTISSSDIKSVTFELFRPLQNNAITAKLGDGLTFDENDAITLDESIKLIIHCVGDPLT